MPSKRLEEPGLPDLPDQDQPEDLDENEQHFRIAVMLIESWMNDVIVNSESARFVALSIERLRSVEVTIQLSSPSFDFFGSGILIDPATAIALVTDTAVQAGVEELSNEKLDQRLCDRENEGLMTMGGIIYEAFGVATFQRTKKEVNSLVSKALVESAN